MKLKEAEYLHEILITGASSGFGRDIAAGFRRTGYAVVVTSRSIRADIANVTTQLEEQW